MTHAQARPVATVGFASVLALSIGFHRSEHNTASVVAMRLTLAICVE